MRFAYKAKTTAGDVKEGSIEADNKRAVIMRLQRQQLFPISVREDNSGKGLNLELSLQAFQRISNKDVVTFTRQMSDLLRSGLALVKALAVLEQQVENEKFRRLITTIQTDVAGGMNFSDALGKHPKVFGELYANMVRAGEVGGMLEAVMERLADFAENELETRSKVIQALAYPCFLVLIGVGVVLLLLLFVMPKLTLMFEDFGQELPLLTKMVMGLAHVVQYYGWMALVVAPLAFWGLRKYAKTDEGRLQIDTLKLKLPVFGDLILKREIAKFARTLGTLLSNGVSILKAMEIVEHTLSNKVLSDHIRAVTADLREGENLSRRLAETHAFPPLVVNMVAVGEETGQLEQSLLRVATSYEISTDRAIKTATTLMEPLFIVIMAVMVGAIALAMIMPIMQLSGNL